MPGGWVQLGAATVRDRAYVSPTAVVVIAVLGHVVPGFVVRRLDDVVGTGQALLIVLPVFLGVLVLVYVVLARSNPAPEAHFERGELRVGAVVTTFDRLTSATLYAEPPVQKQGRSRITLAIAEPHGLTAYFPLRRRDRVLLDERRRELIAEVIRRSAIDVPDSPYDPRRRFTRANFPGALTKDEAIELVRNVPTPGDALPLSG